MTELKQIKQIKHKNQIHERRVHIFIWNLDQGAFDFYITSNDEELIYILINQDIQIIDGDKNLYTFRELTRARIIEGWGWVKLTLTYDKHRPWADWHDLNKRDYLINIFRDELNLDFLRGHLTTYNFFETDKIKQIIRRYKINELLNSQRGEQK